MICRTSSLGGEDSRLHGGATLRNPVMVSSRNGEVGLALPIAKVSVMAPPPGIKDSTALDRRAAHWPNQLRTNAIASASRWTALLPRSTIRRSPAWNSRCRSTCTPTRERLPSRNRIQTGEPL